MNCDQVLTLYIHILESMHTRYNVHPVASHYNTLVDAANVLNNVQAVKHIQAIKQTNLDFAHRSTNK